MLFNLIHTLTEHLSKYIFLLNDVAISGSFVIYVDDD